MSQTTELLPIIRVAQDGVRECYLPSGCPHGVRPAGTYASTSYACSCARYSHGEYAIMSELRAIRALLEKT